MITLDEIIDGLEELDLILDMDEDELLEYDSRIFGEGHAHQTKKRMEEDGATIYIDKCGIAQAHVFHLLVKARILQKWQQQHKSQ